MTLVGLEYLKNQETARANKAKENISLQEISSKENIAREDRMSKERVASLDRLSKEGIAKDDRSSKERVAKDDRDTRHFDNQLDRLMDKQRLEIDRDLRKASMTYDLSKFQKDLEFRKRQQTMAELKQTHDVNMDLSREGRGWVSTIGGLVTGLTSGSGKSSTKKK